MKYAYRLSIRPNPDYFQVVKGEICVYFDHPPSMERAMEVVAFHLQSLPMSCRMRSLEEASQFEDKVDGMEFIEQHLLLASRDDEVKEFDEEVLDVLGKGIPVLDGFCWKSTKVAGNGSTVTLELLQVWDRGNEEEDRRGS